MYFYLMGNSLSSLLVLNFYFWDFLKTNKKNVFKKVLTYIYLAGILTF